MTTERDLRAALATVAAHLARGGVASIAPDEAIEPFAPSRRLEVGEHDAFLGRRRGDGRGEARR